MTSAWSLLGCGWLSRTCDGGEPRHAYRFVMAAAATPPNETHVWDAIGALSTAGTFAVAFVAVVVAWRQLKATRETRLDQTRPYVMVTIEQGLTWFQFLDVVVANVGAGPAHDVRITVDPPLASTYDDGDREAPISSSRYFNEAIPLMPPAYQMRTFFDDYTRRYDTDMPTVFTFTVEYHDGHGNNWKETIVQDLALMNDLEFMQVYGIHDVAKSLREIEKHLKKAPFAKGQPLDVTVEDRAVRESRLKAAHEERRQVWEERKARRDEVLKSTDGGVQGSVEITDVPSSPDGSSS